MHDSYRERLKTTGAYHTGKMGISQGFQEG